MPILLALAVPFSVALLVTTALSPVVASLFTRAGITDIPNERKSHRRPVAYGGGVAMTAGMVAAVFVEQARHGVDVPWVPLCGALLMGCMGFVDDVRPLPPLPRLAIQLLTGAAVGWFLPGGNVWWALLGAVGMAGALNVTNFMDGINGITGATATLWGLTATAAGVVFIHDELAFLGAVTLGAAFGFLPWNVFRPRLFAGDAGAYQLGGIYFGGLMPLLTELHWRHLCIVAAPLSVYVVDTASGILRRVAQGYSPTVPHREFVLHTIVDKGYRHITMTFASVGTAAAVTLCWALLPWPWAVAATLVLLTVYALLPKIVPTRPGVLARRRAAEEARRREEEAREALAQAQAQAEAARQAVDAARVEVAAAEHAEALAARAEDDSDDERPEHGSADGRVTA